MNWFLKLVRWFFPNKVREKEEQESFVERMFNQYLRLVFAMCLGCFMPMHQNKIPTPEQQSCNNEALELAQKILDREVKILTSVYAVKNEMRQPTENSQMKKVVPAPESRTSVEPLTIRQQPGQETLSENETPMGLLPP
jgi:hypothetical protein